jgi:ERCC4-related helicase
MLNTLFTLSALLFIVAMLVQIMAIQAFFNRLDKAHNELYQQMGKPKWKIQLADDTFRDALKYIRSKKFEELNDPELSVIYKKIKMTDYAAMALAALAVGITLFQAVILA